MNNFRLVVLRAGWVFLGIALMAGSVLWIFHSTGTTQPPVRTTVPVLMTIEQQTTATGQVVPRKKVKIKSQANGILEEVSAKPGQWVKHGDLLARIRLRADPVEVNVAQSQINKAQLEHQRAAVELDRRSRLHDQHLISDAAFQDDKLKFDVTKAALEQAERDLELRINGATQQYKTTSTFITATIEGMVLERSVEIGDVIIKANDLSEGTTIMTIADMHSPIFKGEVEEVDAGRLHEGMLISVNVGALPEENFEADLEFISPEARKTDQGRIVFEIRAAIRPKPGMFLRAGYSATAKIVFASHKQVLTIPEACLNFRAQETYVRIELPTGEIAERKISTGFSDGINIEVVSGLNEKDRVVLPQTATAS